MKNLINLVACLLEDSGRLCSVETARDLNYIKTRAQHEGTSFLTITLPDFATEFERALDQGQVDSTFFVGYQKKGCLPTFLSGFTSLVFDYKGRMLNEPQCQAVYCVRQICRVFKKVRLECSYERKERAFENFIQIESDLAKFRQPKRDDMCRFRDISRFLWANVLGSGFETPDLVPKHGPGATAERISGNGKYAHSSWNDRLETVFPFTEHLFTSVTQCFDDDHGLDKMTMVPVASELPVRVIQVPKTLKTPRTIAIEPVCMQYVQQAVARWIVLQIQGNPLTRESIRFNDQTVNQRLALQSSSDRSFATIDLSDASDRVPRSMIRLMLESCPLLWDAIDACRSRNAELPSGRILGLRKFASMGSALCFPIESMYFYTIVVHAIMRRRNLPLNHANLVKVSRGVSIFGDDIIIPKGETATVIAALQAYACKVNVTKSFWNGSFRESCGTDAFKGVDVTPVYVRESAPLRRRDSSAVISWISTSNQFYLEGMWKTASYMKDVVEQLMGRLPIIQDTSPGLGWVSFQEPVYSRSCIHLQVPLVRTFTVRAKRVTDNLDGYPALLKYFLRAHNREIDRRLKPLATDKKHLTSSARNGSVSRKRRWVPAW